MLFNQRLPESLQRFNVRQSPSILLSVSKNRDFTFRAPETTGKRSLLLVFASPQSLEVQSQEVELLIEYGQKHHKLLLDQDLPKLYDGQDFSISDSQRNLFSDEDNRNQYAGFRFHVTEFCALQHSSWSEFNDVFLLNCAIGTQTWTKYITRINWSIDREYHELNWESVYEGATNVTGHGSDSRDRKTLEVHGDLPHLRSIKKISLGHMLLNSKSTRLSAVEIEFKPDLNGNAHPKEAYRPLDVQIVTWSIFSPPDDFPCLVGFFGSRGENSESGEGSHWQNIGVIWGSRSAARCEDDQMARQYLHWSSPH